MRAFVVVMGPEEELEREGGAAVVLRQLGAEVRTLDLWGDPLSLLQDDNDSIRAIVIEAGERPDLAIAALKSVKKVPLFAAAPTILSIPERQVTRLDLSNGFDDFVVLPYCPAELYTRIRALEWKQSEFSNDERVKVGSLVIDRAAHEASLDGRTVSLTAKEFALLSFFAQHRGKVFTREALLARVWGVRYEGGERTVDIHVRSPPSSQVR